MKTIAMHHRIRLLVGVCATVLVVANATAGPISYTDRAAFDAAVSAISGVEVKTLDFESPAVTLPAVFASGSSFQGVSFGYTINGYKLAASNEHPGTSGANTLKLSNDGGLNFANLAIGNVIDFGFGASHAFGLYIIVPTTTFDFVSEDVNLTFGDTTLSNGELTQASQVGANKVAAIFVGFVDPDATYTTAQLRFGPVGATGGAFSEIDDIVITAPVSDPDGHVPEPTTLALLGLGLLGLRLTPRPRRA